MYISYVNYICELHNERELVILISFNNYFYCVNMVHAYGHKCTCRHKLK